MGLQELGGGGRLVVEFGDVAVPLRVVVVGVDHHLARERVDRHCSVVFQRHGNHDDVAGPCRFDGRRRARVWSEFGDERGQGFRPTRIADHDVVPVCHRKSPDLASDVSGTDQSNGRHGTQYKTSTAASRASP